MKPMIDEGTMTRTVKKSRKGNRRPPRSLIAPRTGEKMALRPTLMTTAALKTA